jgi:hypothetical protein
MRKEMECIIFNFFKIPFSTTINMEEYIVELCT